MGENCDGKSAIHKHSVALAGIQCIYVDFSTIQSHFSHLVFDIPMEAVSPKRHQYPATKVELVFAITMQSP